MEKTLFSSDSTWKIISYFLQNPTTETYSRELERLLKISSGSTSTICNVLEEQQILKSQDKANLHLFFLNNENVVVRKLKSTRFLSTLFRYRTCFEHEEFQSVVLYGSYASGEFNEKSDLDLLVITNVEKAKVKELFKEMKDKLPVDISLNIFTFSQWKDIISKNNRFYKEVLSNHILLYGSSILVG